MAEPTSETMGLVRKVREELVDHLPPRFARLYSQHTRLRAKQEELASWREAEASERLDDAIRLLEAAFIEREAGGGNWRDGVRRAGELLEWLSHPRLNPNRLPIRLLASAAYQLAGYPARATGLLNEDIIEDTESSILRFLLKADFPKLFRMLTEYWTTVTSAEARERMSLPWHDPEKLPDRLHQWIVEETASSLGILCAEMRWGNENRISKAIDKLSAIGKVLLHGYDPYSWLLARLCTEAVSVYLQSSLRHHLKELSEKINPTGRNALERYLRQSYQGCRILAWPSQVRGIERLSSGESFALCTPTGSGKTTIAELAILQSLFSEPITSSNVLQRLMQLLDEDVSGALAIYLVPSRALAAEVESKLSSVLCRLGEKIIVTGLYGGTDWGPTDAWFTRRDRMVLICTYEKAEALMRFLSPRFLKRVSLVVIDEAHSIQFDGNRKSLQTAESRSLRLESLGTRLFAHLDQVRSRIIALSAASSGIEDALARWVSGQIGAVPTRTSYRSTRQLIGRLECLPGRAFDICYDLLDNADLRFTEAGRMDTPYIRNPFRPHPPAPDWEKKTTGPEKRLRPYLFWAAMNFAKPDEMEQQHSVLISITQHIGDYAKDFLKLLDSTWKEQSPEFFRPPTESEKLELWDRCLRSCEDYFTTESHEYHLLEKGIVVHYGNMPGLMARLLVEVIQRRIVYLVMATSTLSEGVNLPFETILIPTLRRWPGYMNVHEFSNLAGRAGRPGFGTEGRTLVLLQPEPPFYRTDKGAWKIKKVRTVYFNLVKELSEHAKVCDGVAGPRSPLAELILHLEEQWRRISGTSSLEDFLDWLEQVKPLEEADSITDDEGLSVVEALDSLDSLLLSAIVEIEQIVGEELSVDELEKRLKQIWQRSYARYASEEEARLESIFVQRGKALRSNIYPEPSRRRRLYYTSLPPRSGDRLLKLYPDIRQYLETGGEYANWDFNKRFDYIRIVAKKISDLPQFRLSGKAGRSNVNWQHVLRWWLDPKGATEKPAEDKISDWHSYVNQNFRYRFNWGLGSIIALAIDDAHGDELHMPNVEDWPQTGLPWIVFWLKELIVWGTLEPVAAYLLARRIKMARADAEEDARLYYAEQPQHDNADELLNAVTIRNWADVLSSRDEVPLAQEPSREIEVKLLRDFTDAPKQEWRVVPVEVDNEIHWFDPAGFPLASCQKPEGWEFAYLDAYDFMLDASEQFVWSRAYV